MREHDSARFEADGGSDLILDTAGQMVVLNTWTTPNDGVDLRGRDTNKSSCNFLADVVEATYEQLQNVSSCGFR